MLFRAARCSLRQQTKKVSRACRSDMTRLRCLWAFVLTISLCACPTKDLPISSPKAVAAPPATATAFPHPQTRESDVKAVRVDSYLNRSPREDWYGLYLMEEKVGHARIWARRTQTDEPGSLVTGAETWMKVKGPTGAVTISLVETRFYAQEPPHRLMASRFEQITPVGKDIRHAEMADDGVSISRSDGTQPGRSYKVGKTVETIEKLAVMNPESVDELIPGQTYTFLSFDWQTERDEEISVEVASVEDMRWAGVQTRMAVLQVTYPRMGLTGLSRVVDGGVMLDTTMGPGLRLKLEDREVAKSAISGFDVLGMKVPVVGKFPGPNGRTNVSLYVTVDEKVRLPMGPGQQVEHLGEGTWRVELLKQGAPLPTLASDRRKGLLAQGAIDHEVAAIKQMAKDIVGSEKKIDERVHRLAAWVYENLDKKLATHIPTASAVLKARVGDCTEHTWLFVAFCRTLNIPARPVYGLMLAGPEKGYFLYHAWAEVEIDGHWVGIDPTWNQVPADITHLKLGSEFYELAAILGGIQMEVVGEGPSSRP
jgi:hypothetical protein